MTNGGLDGDNCITGEINGGEVGYSPLFLKLRSQSIVQVTDMMDSTIYSMERLEKSLERINKSTSGVFSASRIWSSFYDPKVVEKLKQETKSEAKKDTELEHV